MVRQRVQQLILAGFAAVVLIATASGASATCRQVHELIAQGFSIGDVANGLGVPVGAVQACLQPVAFAAPNRVPNAAGPPPLGAAGPAPLGAAGPAPLGAAGPAPLGAAGPAPLGAPGPAPLGAAGRAPISSATH